MSEDRDFIKDIRQSLDKDFELVQSEAKKFIEDRIRSFHMPIKDSESRMTFDFDYEFESGDSIGLRYHHTDLYGPTISFLDENGAESFGLPANMFGEVANYLTQKGLLKKPSVIRATPGVAPASIPVMEEQQPASSLSMPNVSRKSPAPFIKTGNTDNTQSEPAPAQVDDSVVPLQSLGSVASVHAAAQPSEPVREMPERSSKPRKKIVSADPDVDEILAERARAASGGASGKGKLKPTGKKRE